ncbi:hypothetical protein C7N43_22685 [Sphingobacteriales bacterium UPWRP_1]|nr:hypothetical protein B6N25_14235 [Sphingobacteriales bacterium TSM_CSS]PSJ74696.1 hypothetical protein C7N43_22685 [Sphingobacteriales bacterium UPWRP_1]
MCKNKKKQCRFKNNYKVKNHLASFAFFAFFYCHGNVILCVFTVESNRIKLYLPYSSFFA